MMKLTYHPHKLQKTFEMFQEKMFFLYRLYSKRIYSGNGISHSFFPRITAFSRPTKMHLNGMLLIGTEFLKIIVPL